MHDLTFFNLSIHTRNEYKHCPYPEKLLKRVTPKFHENAEILNENVRKVMIKRYEERQNK